METEGSQLQTAVDYVLQHSAHKRNIGYVLIKLAWCIDRGNPCPSHKDLADMTGLSKSTVQGALGELEKDGTIERTKNGGAKVRGGYTTCYRLAGHTPLPSKGTPPESKPVESVQDKSVETESVRQESTLTPEPDKHEPDTPSHAHGDAATRETDLSKSSPVLSEKQKTGQDLVAQHNQDAPPENIQPTTYAEALAAAPPEIQAQADALIANAQPPDDGYQDTPPPKVPPEPPAPDAPEAHEFWRAQLPNHALSPSYKKRLNTAVKQFALTAVQDAIDALRLEGTRIAFPMAWIEARLEGQESEGKLPGKVQVARSHSQTATLTAVREDPHKVFAWLNEGVPNG